MNFQMGDLVKLRAGGEKMEIIEFEGQGAKCVWFINSERQIAWVPFVVMVNANKRTQRKPLQILAPSVQ